MGPRGKTPGKIPGTTAGSIPGDTTTDGPRPHGIILALACTA